MAECDAKMSFGGIVDNSHLWYMSSSNFLTPCHDRAGTFDACLLDSGPGEPGWSPGVIQITNTLEDPRFVNHPAISGPPYIRWYSAVEMKVTGTNHLHGTLGVFDFKPREASPEVVRALQRLAPQYALEMESDLVRSMQAPLLSRPQGLAHHGQHCWLGGRLAAGGSLHGDSGPHRA